MLKFEIDENGGTVLNMEGEVLEIAAELGCAVNIMYNRIREVSPVTAEKFRITVCGMVADDTAWEERSLPGETTSVVSVPRDLGRRNDA